MAAPIGTVTGADCLTGTSYVNSDVCCRRRVWVRVGDRWGRPPGWVIVELESPLEARTCRDRCTAEAENAPFAGRVLFGAESGWPGPPASWVLQPVSPRLPLTNGRFSQAM